MEMDDSRSITIGSEKEEVLLEVSEMFTECGGSEIGAAMVEVQQETQHNTFEQLTSIFFSFAGAPGGVVIQVEHLPEIPP